MTCLYAKDGTAIRETSPLVVTMANMTRTAYLRVYQPLSAFPAEERDGWLANVEEKEHLEAAEARRWLLYSALPSTDVVPGPQEGAFLRRVDGEVLVCPWRTQLRMLAGLLAFRGSVPDEVAEAFVPEAQASRAARALDRLESDHPEVRSHIIHANWHVPLRWFAAFDDSERILTEDKHGLRVRYETKLSDAASRLERALKILEGSWIDDAVTDAVRELAAWLGEFYEEGLLELDYGSVARTFEDEELLEDHSSTQVWACLEALEAGDLVRAGKTFAQVSERWTEVRVSEVVN